MEQLKEVLSCFEDLKDNAIKAGMARYGIDASKAYGIKIPEVRMIAKDYKKNHALAIALWDTGIHEGRILATIIDDPRQVSEAQLDKWVSEFYSWDVCDQACSNLLVKTVWWLDKVPALVLSEREYEKRAGFVLMAAAAVHLKKEPVETFHRFLQLIETHADDPRNFVKKAVNWALRQIGKRNPELQQKAIETALRIQQQDSKAARWIAADALRELQNPKTRIRMD